MTNGGGSRRPRAVALPPLGAAFCVLLRTNERVQDGRTRTEA